MRIIFRADASREIGSGHVMRSSVLAEEAIYRGFECIFVGRVSDLDWVSERIANLGFSQVISDEYSFQANRGSDVLVLDSYSIPVSSLFIAKENWRLVLSICDAMTPKYESDIELHPGLTVLDSNHGAPITLSGPDHVLIRSSIKKPIKQVARREVSKVLILGGGSDPFGFVQAISHVLSSMNMNLQVHVFTNDLIPEDSKVKFVKHPIGLNLDFIAGDVDVVFTTASTSSLEFIAREIPTGVACSVENQEDYYNQLGKLGYASQIGFRNTSGKWIFNVGTIREMLKSKEKQHLLKKATNSLIDLRGAVRVMDKLVLQYEFARN